MISMTVNDKRHEFSAATGRRIRSLPVARQLAGEVASA
jgi:hypothetical protein